MIEKFRSVVKPVSPEGTAQLGRPVAFCPKALMRSGIALPRRNSQWRMGWTGQTRIYFANGTQRWGKRDALANYFLTHKRTYGFSRKNGQLKN